MNVASWIILLIVVAFVLWDIRYLMKSKSNCSDCSAGCDSCGSVCKFQEDIKQAKKDLIKN